MRAMEGSTLKALQTSAEVKTGKKSKNAGGIFQSIFKNDSSNHSPPTPAVQGENYEENIKLAEEIYQTQCENDHYIKRFAAITLRNLCFDGISLLLIFYVCMC